MSEIGLALVETDDMRVICETPKFSALEEGTEVYIEAFNKKGKKRGKILAYTDINKNGKEYAFISELGGLHNGSFRRVLSTISELGGLHNGSFRRVLSTIRECPMEWEE